jgi:hypothetical protein
MSDYMPPHPPFSETDAIGIRDALARMIPRSLDDIVRKHRDLVQIGLATAEEIAVRTKRVGLGHSRDTIESWRIVAFRLLDRQSEAGADRTFNSRLSLLGRAVGMRCPWVTSEIVGVDVEGKLVRTRNSLYRLGTPGIGEPPDHDLICLCAMTHSWGVGEYIGAPGLFY